MTSEEGLTQKIGGYTLDREYDMRGIMIPRIGDLLYYDNMDMQAIVQEYDDERFYHIDRFLPIGVIADVSDDHKTLKIVTPYLLKINFDLKERISEKNMIKALKSFVRAYTKEMFNEELEDMKFNLTTTEDLQMIIDNSDLVIQGIDKFEDIMAITLDSGKTKISDLIKKDLLIYKEKDKLKLTYGLCDNFHKVSTNDIRMEDRDTQMNVVRTIKDFKERYEDLETLEGYIIPIATIKLD